MSTNHLILGDIEPLIAGLRRYARALVARDSEDPVAVAESLIRETVDRVCRASVRSRIGNIRVGLYATLTNLNRARLRNATPNPPEAVPRSCGATDAVASLPLDCREAFLLVVLEGFSYIEVSDILGLPRLGLGHRIARARHALDLHLDAAHPLDSRSKHRGSSHLRVIK